mmetsp:Transcript_23761/g.33243  ORF Transcript_23761/g.33243 Transcript_23761/m.33243 type:complete len:280 (-) Transcript_23761:70-909(-)
MKAKQRPFKHRVSDLDSSPSYELRNLHFLVVDDTLVHLKQLQRKLKRDFPESVCHTAKSGEEAIEKVNRYGEEYYSLIFMDQDMYGLKENQLQGAQTVEALRKLGIISPIIMRTTSCSADSLAVYTEAGANAVMPKSTKLLHIKTITNAMLQKKFHLATRSMEDAFFYLKPKEALLGTPSSWGAHSPIIAKALSDTKRWKPRNGRLCFSGKQERRFLHRSPYEPSERAINSIEELKEGSKSIQTYNDNGRSHTNVEKNVKKLSIAFLKAKSMYGMNTNK